MCHSDVHDLHKPTTTQEEILLHDLRIGLLSRQRGKDDRVFFPLVETIMFTHADSRSSLKITTVKALANKNVFHDEI